MPPEARAKILIDNYLIIAADQFIDDMAADEARGLQSQVLS